MPTRFLAAAAMIAGLLMLAVDPCLAQEKRPEPMDRVRLTNGTILLGRVSAVTTGGVSIDLRGDVRQIPLESIAELDGGPETSAFALSLVEAALRAKNPRLAIDYAARRQAQGDASAALRTVTGNEELNRALVSIKETDTRLGVYRQSAVKSKAERERLTKALAQNEKAMKDLQEEIAHPRRIDQGNTTKTTQERVCPTCDGKGKVNENLIKDGDGGKSYVVRRVTCAKCDGTGKLKSNTRTTSKPATRYEDVSDEKAELEKQKREKERLTKEIAQAEEQLKKGDADVLAAQTQRDQLEARLKELSQQVWLEAFSKTQAPVQ